MGRRIEQDFPGAWWHVTNRGICKRTVFESSTDTGLLDELLGRITEQGLLEIHAFSYMPDHFHLLVRSPVARLSYAIGVTENLYVRTFNRSRRRDGSLFRGRFWRRRIDDWLYWESVLRYIDMNPVRARLCARPTEYRHGSAAAFAGGPGPAWLVRTEVERVTRPWRSEDRITPSEYDRFASSMDPEALAHVVERNLLTSPGTVGLAELYLCASGRRRSWSEWKTRLADATHAGLVFLAPSLVQRVVRAARRRGLPPTTPGTGRSALDTIEAGLLRYSCGLRLREIAGCIGVSTTTALKLALLDEQRRGDEAGYDEFRSRLAALTIRRHFGASRGAPWDALSSLVAPRAPTALSPLPGTLVSSPA